MWIFKYFIVHTYHQDSRILIFTFSTWYNKTLSIFFVPFFLIHLSRIIVLAKYLLVDLSHSLVHIVNKSHKQFELSLSLQNLSNYS